MKNMLKDWTKFEIAWLFISTAVILTLSFLWKDTLLGTISSISGILCVVLVAKGKIANYYFGFIQCATYGYIAFTYGLYGESMLNLLFFLPIQFIGFYMWRKHKKENTEAVNGEDVYAKRLSVKQWTVLLPVVVVACIGYAYLLTAINAQQVRLDSVAVVLSIVAQFLMLLRYAEQWVLWIVINVLTITLWVLTLVQSGGNDWTILAMWISFLVNSIWGYVNWLKISKRGDVSLNQ